uniref:SUEL-type lectin domain-containing protein n=1 Tax=Xiphophorus maculatus TaxID=8083 RepID=A0A3B5PU33_XIPMA
MPHSGFFHKFVLNTNICIFLNPLTILTKLLPIVGHVSLSYSAKFGNSQIHIYLGQQHKKSLVACEGTVARLHCEGQAIYVTSATYGRTDKKTCSARRPADQLKNTECFTYAEEVGERCNGKQWCKVKASNYVFGDPCYGTYKYLEVEYICYGEFRLSLH